MNIISHAVGLLMVRVLGLVWVCTVRVTRWIQVREDRFVLISR